ncbi:MAG: glycosyltransferase family 4 protein [Candidatus Thorarchaeota archaeon]
MKIGKVSKFGSADGLCIRAQSVLEGLQERGHEMHAFTQAKHVENLSDERVHRFPAVALNPHFYIDSIGASKMIAKKSAELDIDLLHVQMNSSSTEFFLPLFKKSLPPLVVTYHLAYAQGSSMSTTLFAVAWKASLFATKRYDEIVLVDPSQKPYFVNNGIPEDKLTVVKNGVETDLFSPDYAKRDDDIIDFVYVGRLSIDKGVNILLDAFMQYHEENPKSRLTLMGDGMLKHQYKGCIEDEAVCWLGAIPHDEIPEVLQRSDVFVIPQNIGGLGLSVMEAMGCGLPIITTAIGETKRLLSEDEGVLVEPNSRPAVVDAMRVLAEDKNKRESMGRKCREKVVRDYSWSNQIGFLEDVYRRVLE